jgi:transposase-like protein
MTPMERDSRKAAEEEGFTWGPDTIEAEIRGRIRGMIEAIVEQELEATLGAGRSQRVGAGRTGYRHGARERQLTTSLGKTTIMLPRARLKEADGEESEWHSRIIPRYQRRTERVDSALLGSYLSGINTRRLRGALSPLLRGAPLSKDAVSRLVGRLRDEFAAWARRDLAAEEVCYIFMDGWYPRVRIGKKRTRVPVLVTLGVCADGRRIAFGKVTSGRTFPTGLVKKSFRRFCFVGISKGQFEDESVRLGAILSIISPAFPRTSISIPRNDECVYGSGHTR